MASVQCYKTCEESCQEKSQHSSFGQKVSDLFKGNHHHEHGQHSTTTHTQYCSQTQVQSQPGHTTVKTHQTESCSCSQTNGHHQHHATTGTACPTKCHGRGRREQKRNLFQKIKDGLSGHSSDSSSESDSDNEKCLKGKN